MSPDPIPLPGLRAQIDATAICLRDAIGSGDISATEALTRIAALATSTKRAEADMALLRYMNERA